MKTNPYFFRIALFFIVMLNFVGCSGNDTQLAGGAGGTGVSHGVMTKGSVIVNGVRYDDTTANISIDDTPKTALNLHDGMVVSVRGNASGRNGTATEIRGQIEVRGLVTAKDPAVSPQRFTVFNQTVIVDDLTKFSNITFAGITAGTTIVEVHGQRQRDALGNIYIRATRIEGSPSLTHLPDGTGMANPLEDEIRGVVSGGAAGPNPTTFFLNLGTQAVNAANATIVGGSYANGSIVEVHCTRSPGCLVNGVFQASRIEVEDTVNLPEAGQRFEVEGMMSNFTAHPGSFFVDNIPVTTTARTTFRGGIATDLLNNIKVEAEGTWDGTKLTADKIEFKRAVVRLQGVVTASAANTFTLRIGDAAALRTITVEADSFTLGAVPLAGPACVQVRGRSKDVVGAVTAGEIGICSQGDDHVLQAPLDAKADPNLTVLGFSVNVGAVGVQFRNINDSLISKSAFFNLISATDPTPPAVAGSLVRIRFDKNNLATISEVELED